MLKVFGSKPWLGYVTVLVILLVLLVYTQFREKQYEVVIEPIFKFKPEEVTSFSVTKDGVSVTITKKDTVWVFAAPDTGQPAKYKIEQFMKDIVRGEREGVFTSDTAKYSQLGVSEEMATQLVIRYGEKELATIYVGRSSSDYNREFIRYIDQPHVYPSRQKMINKLGAVASWWR